MQQNFTDMNRIGERIKKKREILQLNLSELAEKVGISSSALSQIEKAKSFPSLHTLKSIAESLHTTVGELIGENESLQNNPVVHKKEVILINQTPSGTNVFQLSHHDINKRMDTFLLQFNKESDSSGFFQHSHGQIFVHVLKGMIQFSLDGRIHVLKQGDNVYFNAKSDFNFLNNSNDTCEILCVQSPPYF